MMWTCSMTNNLLILPCFEVWRNVDAKQMFILSFLRKYGNWIIDHKSLENQMMLGLYIYLRFLNWIDTTFVFRRENKNF